LVNGTAFRTNAAAELAVFAIATGGLEIEVGAVGGCWWGGSVVGGVAVSALREVRGAVEVFVAATDFASGRIAGGDIAAGWGNNWADARAAGIGGIGFAATELAVSAGWGLLLNLGE